MALYHRATLTPSKLDAITAWAPRQPWGPADDEALVAVGSYRFDDPEGRVGMEVHLVRGADALFQVPLTYRDAPLAGAEEALVTEMHHSALGARWVYDGLRDPALVVMLTAAAMTGQGEAVGMVDHDGRWVVVPSAVRIQGGGWGQERVPVDGFVLSADEATGAVLENDRLRLVVHRRPVAGPRPPIGLTATWDGQPDPVVLAAVTSR